MARPTHVQVTMSRPAIGSAGQGQVFYATARTACACHEQVRRYIGSIALQSMPSQVSEKGKYSNIHAKTLRYSVP